MKSVRLTNQMRTDILRSILQKWDENNPSSCIEAAENKLADWVWNKQYSKFKKKLEDAPSGFLKMTERVKFVHMGEVLDLPLSEPMPCDWESGYLRPMLHVFHTQQKEVEKLLKARDIEQNRNEQRCEIYEESKAVLESVQSTKQLLETWPEAEPFIPAYIINPSKGVRLPATPVSRLNERLGLDGAK